VEGVDAGERFGAQEGGVVAARRGLEVTRTAGGGGADRVDDQWVVRFEGGDEHRGTGVFDPVEVRLVRRPLPAELLRAEEVDRVAGSGDATAAADRDRVTVGGGADAVPARPR